MIISALITQCRQDFGDIPKSTQKKRTGDGSSTLYNVGDFPVVEGSYAHYVNNTLKAETTDYSFDLDSGDLQLMAATSAEIRSEFKYAKWRDANWRLAINNAVEELNARGYFRQVVRDTSVMALSANVRVYSGPTNAVDVYELLRFDNRTVSGNYQRLPGNWSYQQDANKVVLAWKPFNAEKLATSYLRNLQTYTATSATIDVINDWIVLLKKKAGAQFYRYMAGKVAKQGNANIDEGHYSFTALRTMAADLDNEFDLLARRKKPTRPAKGMQYHVDQEVDS